MSDTDKGMSRRKFLASAGTVAGAAAVASMGLAKITSPAEAASAVVVPWPYPTKAADQPDPEAMARRAFEVYFVSGCAEASWWPIIEFLSPKYPDSWGTMPKNVFRYGGGGIGSWGTICGTVNGTCALTGMVVGDGTHRTNLIDALMQYYANTALPTNAAWKSYQKELGLTTAWAPTTSPLKNVPSSTAHSPLCHSSLVQWTMTTGATNGGPLQKDRCGKACFDMVRKNTELLNTYFQMVAPSAAPVALDPSVAACRTCHVTYTGAKMACNSCHDETLHSSSGQ
jgi:hypothetical protein